MMFWEVHEVYGPVWGGGPNLLGQFPVQKLWYKKSEDAIYSHNLWSGKLDHWEAINECEAPTCTLYLCGEICLLWRQVSVYVSNSWGGGGGTRTEIPPEEVGLARAYILETV